MGLDYKKINENIGWVIRLIMVFGLILLTALFFQGFIREYSAYLSELIGNHRLLGGAVFILTSILAAFVSFFTNIPLLPPAIGVWGQGLTFIFLSAGWILGAGLGYLIGYFALREAVMRSSAGRRIDYYRARLKKNTEFWIVVLFRMSVPSEVSSYALGAIRYNFGKFMIATILTELPFAWLAVVSSQQLLEGRTITFAVLVSGGLVFIILAAYYLKRHFGDLK